MDAPSVKTPRTKHGSLEFLVWQMMRTPKKSNSAPEKTFGDAESPKENMMERTNDAQQREQMSEYIGDEGRRCRAELEADVTVERRERVVIPSER